MKRNFAKLIDVKSIVTLILVTVFGVLCIRQNVTISTELLASVVTAVLTYLFTKKKSTNQDNSGEE